MNWTTLSLTDFDFLRKHLAASVFMGSDCSLVNLFLLQKKYDTQTAIEGGFLFRYYAGAENRTGYGFPLALTADGGTARSLSDALSLIVADAAANNRPVRFCLCDETQKNALDDCMKARFPELALVWRTSRDDSDYIYERQKLAALAGKTYHKKKNHVSRFLRAYEGNWEFRLLSLCRIDNDLILVAQQWLEEHFAAPPSPEMGTVADDATDAPSAAARERERHILQLELDSIRTAVQNKADFALEGGVLYVHGVPVAMTLASRIGDDVLDVHFEKCLASAAANGAYAAINWCFANACDGIRYLNREEDMGVEGLRKAKLSYHPDLLVDKYYAFMESPC